MSGVRFHEQPGLDPLDLRESFLRESFGNTYSAGKRARREGRPRGNCPFVESETGNTHLRDAWMLGWCEADLEERT